MFLPLVAQPPPTPPTLPPHPQPFSLPPPRPDAQQLRCAQGSHSVGFPNSLKAPSWLSFRHCAPPAPRETTLEPEQDPVMGTPAGVPNDASEHTKHNQSNSGLCALHKQHAWRCVSSFMNGLEIRFVVDCLLLSRRWGMTNEQVPTGAYNERTTYCARPVPVWKYVNIRCQLCPHFPVSRVSPGPSHPRFPPVWRSPKSY